MPLPQARIERYSQSEIRFNLMAITASRADELRKQLAAMPQGDPALADLTHQLALEEQKLNRWKAENIRRKHNYVPFIVNLLKLLAERGELMPLVDAAKSRKKARG